MIRNALSAAALLVLGVLCEAAAQEGTHVTSVAPCVESCGLALEIQREYGEGDGPAMIEADWVRGWLDESGRMYLAGATAGHVLVFGRDGSFLRRIGRAGSGPGELEHLTSLVVRGDGLFSTLDRRRGMILTFDWTGALRNETRSRGWSPRGTRTIHVEGPLAVHHADLRTPDLVGYPLHLVNLESGEVEESFGSMTGEYDPQTGFNHVIASGPGRAVWMAERYAYRVELWESNRLLRSLRRDVEWFPELRVADRSHGWDERPSTAIAGMAADDSLLWLAIAVADEQWEENARYRDQSLSYDTVVEVIDWKRGRVIGSGRFDEDYVHWVRPGMLGRLVVTPDGSVRYRTVSVRLGGVVPESGER